MTSRGIDLRLAAALGLFGALGMATGAWANHPVLVEGNCFGPGMGGTATGLQTSPVAVGTCGDYDGDGLIGADEDADGDNNFGTIGAAVAAVANNGRVLIVTSGVFAEGVRLTPTDGGNVSVEAAPGVDANIDAVVQGDPGSGPRQGGAGIIIDGCDACRVVVRNVMVRNWIDGIIVRGASHAVLDGVRLEGNVDNGILVIDHARVAISESDINGTGFRKGGLGIAVPAPGNGVTVGFAASVSIVDSSVTGSAASGVKARRRNSVHLDDVQLFDNRRDLDLGGKKSKKSKKKKKKKKNKKRDDDSDY